MKVGELIEILENFEEPDADISISDTTTTILDLLNESGDEILNVVRLTGIDGTTVHIIIE